MESKGKAQRMLCSKGMKGAEFCLDLNQKGTTANTVIKLIFKNIEIGREI